MKLTRILCLSILVILFILSAHQCYANPYVGFYYRTSPLETTRVVLNITFYPTYPNVIPSDNRLSAVISVATGRIVNGNVNLSGYVYQLGANLFSSGLVYFAPQLWYGNNITMIRVSEGFDIADEMVITLIMEISGNNVVFCVYEGAWGGRKLDYSYTYTLYISEDRFIVGSFLYSGVLIRTLQYGIEPLNNNFYNNWYITMWDAYYYNPSTGFWDYSDAYTVQGDASVITYIDGYMYIVGGEVLTNTNYRYSTTEPISELPSMGNIEWYRDVGHTIKSDELIFRR